MICGTASLVTMDVHEMVRRSHAPKSWCRLANFLLVCRRCHDTLLPNMPLEKQLAYKLLCDPDCFSIAEVSRIRNNETPRLKSVVKWLVHIIDKEGYHGTGHLR